MSNQFNKAHSGKVFSTLVCGFIASLMAFKSMAREAPDLVSAGATWKYMDDGSDQGKAWREPDFNDGAWAQGPAKLGYGDDNVTTVIEFGGEQKNKFITTYFRHTFEVADPAKYKGLKSLALGTVCDDGCVAYLNGKEVWRTNLPEGEVLYKSLALRPIDKDDELKFLPGSVDPALLRKGRNVIAVEVHQQRPSSSDLGLDLRLSASEAAINQSTAQLPAAVTTTATLTSAFDGPYIVARSGGGWENWTVAVTDTGLAKYSKPVAVGDTLTIQAVGSRPAFQVKLRKPAAPEPDEAAAPKNVPMFLMADSHGEFEICTEMLIKQGVIDKDLNWSFGKGRLVVLGDIFDRGPRQTEILWLLYKLEAEAQAAGGRVHLNLGNHEVMVLNGDLRYLNSRYSQAARALGANRYSDLWSKETLLGQWLRSKPTVFKLGDILCLHGGISSITVSDHWSLEQINSTVRAQLNGDAGVDRARAEFIIGSHGPLWHRGHVDEKDNPEDIARVLDFYKVKHIAVGHTKVDVVKALYGGDVIAVQVYPVEEAGRMNMEGVYIDKQGVWHRASIDGTREILKSGKGEPLGNASAGRPAPYVPECKEAA